MPRVIGRPASGGKRLWAALATRAAVWHDRAEPKSLTMASAALKQPTTLDEFLDWEERQHERHDRLTRQVANALEGALGDCGGFVHGPLVKVLTPSGAATYPDVLVDLEPDDESATTADDPIALFEVLSPGNVHDDPKRKRRHYETIPSLRLIGFVWPDTVAVSFAVREDEVSPWRDGEAEGLDAVLAIDALGIEVALRDVYARTGMVLEAEGL